MARLSDSEIDERLEASQWGREGDTLAAMELANAVAAAANAADHHPDILVHDYKHVRLTLSTHSEGGITENDFALATTIDGLDVC